jgi:hypothetical protein
MGRIKSQKFVSFEVGKIKVGRSDKVAGKNTHFSATFSGPPAFVA